MIVWVGQIFKDDTRYKDCSVWATRCRLAMEGDKKGAKSQSKGGPTF